MERDDRKRERVVWVRLGLRARFDAQGEVEDKKTVEILKQVLVKVGKLAGLEAERVFWAGGVAEWRSKIQDGSHVE